MSSRQLELIGCFYNLAISMSHPEFQCCLGTYHEISYRFKAHLSENNRRKAASMN